MLKPKEIIELHKPVLVKEVLEAFGIVSDSIALSKKRLKIIDATLGVGGHTEMFVKHGASVLGVDADKEMLDLATERLKIACPTPEKNFRGSYKLVKGNFKDLYRIAQENDFLPVDGILFDLGISSPQITSSTRGFSFQSNSAGLDMRVDRQESAVMGSDLLNLLRLDQLREIFNEVLNYRTSHLLAKSIIEYRKEKKIETVGDYNEIIHRVLHKTGKKSVETLPFLALRIAVNSEFMNIEEGLNNAISALRTGGRIATISFHSGEDKLVKNNFLQFHKKGLGFMLNKKPITPGSSEIEENVRSRSALLRVFEKYEQKNQFIERESN